MHFTDYIDEKTLERSIDKDLYVNKELSLLSFNERILFQAMRPDVPLFERIKFLGIFASNMDEFLMVRASKLLVNVREHPLESRFDGMTYTETLKQIKNEFKRLRSLQNKLYVKLIRELGRQDIFVSNYDELNSYYRKRADELFEESIKPLIFCNAEGVNNDDKHIKGKCLYIWAFVSEMNGKDLCNARLISIHIDDKIFDRYYKISGHKDKNQVYVLVEDLIVSHINDLFVGQHVHIVGVSRFLRSADYRFDNACDISTTEKVEELLSTRDWNEIISYDLGKIVKNSNYISYNKLKEEFNGLCQIKPFRIDNRNVPIQMNFLAKFSSELASSNDLSLVFDEQTPQFVEELVGCEDMFMAIDRKKDIILHHPFQSYDPVIKLLEDAARDKDVCVIQQTLYRLSSLESPIVNALCHAAENGKSVRVLLEIKARFDEGQNMAIREKLKSAGVIVMYSRAEIKVHGKSLSIIRREEGKFKYYSHLATGNYNEKSAAMYTDLSYLTNDQTVGIDLSNLFQKLACDSEPTQGLKMKTLIPSPNNLKGELIKMINQEASNARAGLNASIIFKMNALGDKDIIDALYKASASGVKVYLMVRGICCMKPLNKNITIKSVVGRYLEHSRIYYFSSNGKNNIFISSADCLPRNLDRRIEFLIPIRNTMCKNKILKILSTYMTDEYNSYIMKENGNYLKITGKKSAHEILYNKARISYFSRTRPKFKKERR